MILIDTSVWIDHLHRSDADLSRLLERNEAAVHSAVIGELALGSIADRETVLGLLAALPHVMEAGTEEVLGFVTARRLFDRGLSLVDAHLLAATALTPGAALWTRDRRLRTVAAELGLAWEP